MVVLHIAAAIVVPPARYPDIFPALFAIFGFANLAVAYVYVIILMTVRPT